MMLQSALKKQAASKKLAAAWRAKPISHIFLTSLTKQKNTLVITTIQIYEARIRMRQLTATSSVQNLLRKQPRKMTYTTLPVQCRTSIMQSPSIVLPLISLLQKYSLSEQSTVLARAYLMVSNSFIDYYYQITSLKQSFTASSSKLHLIEKESTPSQLSTRLRLRDNTDSIAGKLATNIHILFESGRVPLDEREMRAWQKGPNLPRAVVREPKKYLLSQLIKEIEQGTALERRMERETPMIILPTSRAAVFLDRMIAIPTMLIVWASLMLFSLPSFQNSHAETPSWKKMPVTNIRELLRLQKVEAFSWFHEKIREEIEEIWFMYWMEQQATAKAMAPWRTTRNEQKQLFINKKVNKMEFNRKFVHMRSAQLKRAFPFFDFISPIVSLGQSYLVSAPVSAVFLPQPFASSSDPLDFRKRSDFAFRENYP